MARSAAKVNQMMLPWPRGMTMKAAASGPIDEPRLPPTWNSDCASPCCPPDPMRATRDASGWKMAEPSPTKQAAPMICAKLAA